MVAVEVEKGLERLRQRAESGRAQRTRLQRFNALEIRHPTPGNRMLRAKPACAPSAPRVYCAARRSATQPTIHTPNITNLLYTFLVIKNK